MKLWTCVERDDDTDVTLSQQSWCLSHKTKLQLQNEQNIKRDVNGRRPTKDGMRPIKTEKACRANV